MVESNSGSEPQPTRREIERRLALRRELDLSKPTGVKVYRALKKSRPEVLALRRLLRETPD